MKIPVTDNKMWADQGFGQAVLDTLSAQIAVLDKEGTILAVNKAWTLFAAENNDPGLLSLGIGASYLDAARNLKGPYSADGQAAYLGIKAVLDGSLPQFSLEYPCHTALQQRWFLLTVSPIAETPLRAAVVSHLDITPRKHTEETLRESEEQFRELAVNIRQVLWMVDATGAKVRYFSPAYEKIWGRSCQSLFDNPRSFVDAIHSDDRERVIRALAMRHQTGRYEEEYRILRPDGSMRWIWDRGYPVQAEQGPIQGFAGIAEDITERKANEEDRSRLAAILECSDDSIVSMTLQGIIISWNHGAERLYGYSAEEMIGSSISVLFTPDHYQEYLQVMKQVRRGEPLPSRDTLRRRQDGTLINVSVGISPIETRQGEIVGASKISHDISRVKQLEEQFRQAQKMEAVGRLAGGVAHDFNNLLTVISGYSEMLLDAALPGDRTRDLLLEIKKASMRAASLTRQLLTFSRKQVLEPKVLCLNTIVADSEKMLRRLVGEDVELATVLDPALGRVKTDPGQIEQVLMNLVVNARDALPQGGKITLETANVVLDQTYCRPHAELKPGRYIMLAVSDNGCGMDEQTKSHIFEPFFTTKGPEQGTGLGLAMVYGAIKQSSGHVFVDSELGTGTTFKIYLPEVEEAYSAEKSQPAIEKTPQGDETILVVEDEPGVRALILHVLRTYGYTVLEAAHGSEAIRLTEKHPGPIHLLITDVVMPGIGGRQVAEQVVALKPDIKVMYLSGYTNDAVVRHGVLESTVAFLQKPFTPSALALKVRQVLDQ
jgi:two-component system, cell cycle sensor histidine kinase and response regulator CckA